MRTRSPRAVALCLVSSGTLFAASPASAGTIRYDIQPSDQYTVTDNDTGIAKLEWNGCLTVGQSVAINFTVVLDASNDGQAGWEIIKEDDPIVGGTFSPNPVDVVKDQEQSIPTTLTYSVSAASGSAVDFRAKLDPENGVGLGEGPGIMVRVPCVVESAPSPAPAAARGTAVCIPAPVEVHLRAKKRGKVRVEVVHGDQWVQGSLVTLTGPGFSRRGRTGAGGLVTFGVLPKHKGELVIQADVCSGSRRFAVRGASASSPAGGSRPAGATRPQFTG